MHFPFFESFSNSIREANLKKSEENIMGAYKLKYPTKGEKENLLKLVLHLLKAPRHKMLIALQSGLDGFLTFY